MPLLDLLEETNVFASTLPGDKVYGVMFLAGQSVSVPVDYALSGEEIFTRLAIEFLENRQSLDILSHCMLPATQSKLKLPSWVPDWTVHKWVEPFRSRMLKANAAGSSKPRIRINQRNGELWIWEMREAMARTFACNRTGDGLNLGADFKLGFDLHSMVTCTEEPFEAVCRWMAQEATGASETSREGRAFGKKMMKAYEELTGVDEKWCFNRRFARTANNEFG